MHNPIPKGYIKYEFGANFEEDDRQIVGPGIEAMERLCHAHQTLTVIRSGREYPEKQKYHPAPFPVRCREFLQNMGASVSHYARDERTLYVLTKGLDKASFWMERLDAADNCFFDFFLLPDDLDVLDAESAASAADEGRYDVRFELNQYGPCALYITLNPEHTDAEAVQSVIQEICQEHNILFMNPPTGPPPQICLKSGGFYAREQAENPAHELFCLYPAIVDDDPLFPAVALECAVQIMDGFPGVVNQLLLNVLSEKLSEDPSIQAYLRAGGTLTFDTDRTLHSVTRGIDRALVDCIPADERADYEFCFYGYDSMAAAQRGGHDWTMRAAYCESHDYLLIETGEAIEEMIRLIQAACENHGRVLIQD